MKKKGSQSGGGDGRVGPGRACQLKDPECGLVWEEVERSSPSIGLQRGGGGGGVCVCEAVCVCDVFLTRFPLR